MVESAVTTTLHYQIVYRVHDHAFKLLNQGSEDSLLISVNTREEPHCVHVPKQISKQELLNLLPEKWVTNYEHIHQHDQPIRSTKSQIITRADGTSEIKFDHSHLKQLPTPPIFSTQMMLQPIPSDGSEPGQEAPLIQSFQPNGKPLYFFKDPTRHCPWDINCSCDGCQNATFEDLDEEIQKTRRKKNRKKST
ncbi:uncharacterized protein LOC105800939 [Gossypium raimondii]|uniref:uncharacterized protein LOC105800939 n=1 Tax=Gossypium raimondii TaxID=29730 RepID=UPI00063ABF7B|nr:uncharacterized protein LOC105800939 [Gossypium raimondii]